MKITIDTTHDSHENIKNAIKMLQAIVGEDILTNADVLSQPAQEQATASPMMNIFGEVNSDVTNATEAKSESEITEAQGEPAEEIPSSSSDEELFADIFNQSDVQQKKDENKKDSSGIIEFY